MAQQEVTIQVGLLIMRLKEHLKLSYLLVLGKKYSPLMDESLQAAS